MTSPLCHDDWLMEKTRPTPYSRVRSLRPQDQKTKKLIDPKTKRLIDQKTKRLNVNRLKLTLNNLNVLK